jgi:hypothetical protein
MRLRRLGKRSASLLPGLTPLALLFVDRRGPGSATAAIVTPPNLPPRPEPLRGREATGRETPPRSLGEPATIAAETAFAVVTLASVSTETEVSAETALSSAAPSTFLQPASSGTTSVSVPIADAISTLQPPTSNTKSLAPGSEVVSGIATSSTAATPTVMTTTEMLLGADGIVTRSPLPGTENAIVLENRKPGNPRSEWDLHDGIGSTSIEGFATAISIQRGGRVDFKVDTAAGDYRIDIYRLGWYGGLGARKVASIDHGGPGTVQPVPLTDPTTRLIDAGNWSVTDSWTIPSDAVSGIYLAKLVREDGTFGENHIPFVVRSDDRASDILFQTSDTTWVAYNPWGGINLYQGPEGRAYAVSYNRPFTTRLNELQSGPQDWIFGAEYPALLWLERNGYDVSYISGVDAARDGAGLLDHKVFLSVGHDEYWAGEQRANVEAAREAGVNLQFWSGNEVYWKIRWETAISADGTPYRTLVCYKETKAGANIDPSSEWTGTWRDPRFGGTGLPENALTGSLFQVDSYRLDTISVPFDMTRLRFWRDTRIADTAPGGTGVLNGTYLGYEWNIAPDNGFSPEGLIRLSSSTHLVDSLLLDYGTTVGSGTATHNLTLYRDASSGALVFGAGSVYWSWALDPNHDNEPTPADPAVQQAMVNLFAEMGIQPQTLETSLVIASATTDFAGPTASITSNLANGRFLTGSTVSITGTAYDVGGYVAGVEVSTDGGASWRPARGTTDWSYSWTVQGALGERTVLARAIDDSVNFGAPTTGIPITVYAPPEATIWSSSIMPANPSVDDRRPVELGLRFTADQAVDLKGFRFYKGIGNDGPHSARLWSASGTLLVQTAFTEETASGWQTVMLPSSYGLSAGSTYVVSYHSTTGYAATGGYFSGPILSGDLTVAGTNGVYAYGAAGSFPTATYNATNYWVDIVYTPSETPVNRVPTARDDGGFEVTQGSVLALSSSALLANDTDPEGAAFAITGVGDAVNGSVAWNPTTQIVTFTPTADYVGSASFRYTISDGVNAATATVSLAVAPPATAYTLFGGTTPAAAANDGVPVNLGTRFVAGAGGTITALRFFKPANETGAHTGHLWTAGGTLLGSASFTPTASGGWQTAALATPISVTSGATYVVSYSTTGTYAYTARGLSAPISSGPLTAPGTDNGVFAYGPAGLFPTASFNATNYFADVVYYRASENRPPVAVADSGFVTTKDKSLVIDVSALLANDTDPDGDVPVVTGVTNAVNGLASLDAATGRITFVPLAGYTGEAGFTYAIADGNGGASTASVSLTVTAPPAGAGLFAATDTPAILTVNDPNPVELGVKFTTSTAGEVTALKFYKGPSDTGPHEGSLWTASGTLLATTTFTGETASGWQTANLATPVTLSAGGTYVVSYQSNGFYTATPDYFTTAITQGPLTAPASDESGGNGVYSYGPAGSFPTSTYNRTNYWADVVFNGQLAA